MSSAQIAKEPLCAPVKKQTKKQQPINLIQVDFCLYKTCVQKNNKKAT